MAPPSPAFACEVNPEEPSWGFDTDKYNVTYGRPGDKSNGYFVAGAGAEGAQFSTAGGDVQGKIDLGDPSGQLQFGPVTANANVSDDTHYRLGATGSIAMGDGSVMLPQLQHQQSGDNGTTTAGLAYRDGDTTRSVSGTLDGKSVKNETTVKTPDDTVRYGDEYTEGQRTTSLDARHQMPDGTVISGGVSTGDKGNGVNAGVSVPDGAATVAANGGVRLAPDGTPMLDGGASIKGKDGSGSVSVSAGGDAVNVGLSATSGPVSGSVGLSQGPQGTTTNGSFAVTPVPGLTFSGSGTSAANEESGKLGVRYASPDLAADATLSGKSGDEYGTEGALSTQLIGRVSPDFYLGGTSRFGMAGGEPNFALGANMTYTPVDELGLSAGGSVGTYGPAARLQADVFPGGVNGAGDLMKQRTSAALSAYAEVGPITGQASPLDQTFGKGKEVVPVTAGDANFTFGVGYAGSF